MKSAALIVILCVIALSNAKKFTPEEFKGELARSGVTGQEADMFTCIANYVSGLSTKRKVVGAASSDFGIFQISNAFWCSPPGSACGMTCESLLDDDIQNDIQCALKIKSIHGFEGWRAYEAFCKNHA